MHMEFKTRDFYSAAILLASERDLLSVEKTTEGFSVFIFNESPDTCRNILDQHISGQLKLQTWTLVNAIRSLKSRLYQ